MPFTSSNGFAAAAFGSALKEAPSSHASCLSPHLALLPAILRRDLLLVRVLPRRRLDHRTQQLRIGLVEVRRVAPLLAVPGMDARLVQAGMVAAGGLERLDEALHAERLDA